MREMEPENPKPEPFEVKFEWANSDNLTERLMYHVTMEKAARHMAVCLFFCSHAEKIKSGLDSDTFNKMATDFFDSYPNSETMVAAAQSEWELRKSSPDQPASAVIEKEKEEID